MINASWMLHTRTKYINKGVFTSLKAKGKPSTPAPMNEIKMLAIIFTGFLEPGPVDPPPTVMLN